MLILQHELKRIQDFLTSSRQPDRYGELYAAQQALVWAMNPETFMSPAELLASADTREGSGDCLAGSCHSEFSGILDLRAAAQPPTQTFLVQPPSKLEGRA